ncbi:HAD family phosphatase [Streptomyces sp. SID161]|uniref:HAD-IA family hydrolase n=1 Tax=Streptomyces sp. SID161 TaxID=2690251 RepID=UPI00136FCF70|nr:HAD-IA family hydrolase [Streptomyces sp. SID161]
MTGTDRATVFDLDDTLVDTAEMWPRVCAAFTARHGHRWRDDDSAALHGNGDWAQYVAALCGAAAGKDEVVEVCTAAMVDACAAGLVRALPGASRLVDEARRHGPVAVATASPRLFTAAVLEHLGLRGRVNAVVCGEDVRRAKPAPDAYLHAAAALGVPPWRCVAVEDSPNGIRSAAAAGLRVLAVPRGGAPLPADAAALSTAQAPSAVAALPLLTRLHDDLASGVGAPAETTGRR